MTYVLVILAISLLIVLHELGHYAVARACGMRVVRFSIGFGPALLSLRGRETIWQIAAIPLGGFVQILGMGPDDSDDDPRSFRRRPVWQRSLVMAAGPACNWLFAVLCIILVATSAGFTDYDESQAGVGDVSASSPAERAGLKSGDRIVTIDGAPVADWAALTQIIAKSPDKPLTLVVERDGVKLTLTAVPMRQDDIGFLGIGPPTRTIRVGVGEGIVMGFTGAYRATIRQVVFLYRFATRQAAGKVSGVPGIVKMVAEQAERGVGYLLEALGSISIALFIFNLLPVPALDGGRLVFLGIEAIRRRPMNQLVEGWVHAVGLLLLLGLMIFVSIRDLL